MSWTSDNVSLSVNNIDLASFSLRLGEREQVVALDLPLRAAGPSRAGAVRCRAPTGVGLGYQARPGPGLGFFRSTEENIRFSATPDVPIEQTIRNNFRIPLDKYTFLAKCLNVPA